MNYICIMSSSAFIFDDVRISPDRQIDLHSGHAWELSYVLTGSGSRTIGSLTEPFTQGEVVLIPPDIPHVWRFNHDDVDVDGNIGNISIFFDSSLIQSLMDLIPEISESFGRIVRLDHAVSYTGDRRRRIQELMRRMQGMVPEQRVPLMIELLVEISDVSGAREAGRKSTLTRAEQRLEAVRVYCACNYSRPIGLDDISRYVGMNKSAFCTFMKHCTGMTYSEYLNDMRLAKAKEMLRHTENGIAEIALDCGFQNVTYFNRLFKRKYACTPKEMRGFNQ